VARIAAARGVAPERIQAVLDEATEERDLGFLGEPRVNVLLANLALDRRFGAPAAPPATAR
jgi:K+-transporting ATPase ATPase C chain